MFFSWRIFFIFCLIALFILQQTLLVGFVFLAGRLNLVLVCLLLYLFFENKKKNFSLAAGVIVGLLFDIFSPQLFGVFTISLTLACLLVKQLADFFKKSDYIGFTTAFLAFFIFYFLCNHAVKFILGMIFKVQATGLSIDFETLAFSLIFNFVLATPFYLLLRKKYGLAQ